MRTFDHGELATPHLLVRTDILDRNLASMQRFADASGLVLRPHAKTHKMVEAARRQVQLGSTGLTVATIDEAEAFLEAGFADLFIGYSIWSDDRAAARLLDLANGGAIAVAIDSQAGLERLAAAGEVLSRIRVRVEVDCGLRRSGVTPAEAARLGVAAARAGAAVDGVFTYPGHGYAPGAADQAARDEADTLAQTVEEFAAAGLDCPVRSGASTPTVHATHTDVITEIRPGVYAFNDAQQLALGTATQADIALTVVTTVISFPSPDRFVLDAGSKTIASDRPPYVEGFGLLLDVPGARIERIWEHHAVVDAAAVPAARRPRIGQRLQLIPNHVCTAVNLADTVLATDGTTAGVWRVLARGRNS